MYLINLKRINNYLPSKLIELTLATWGKLLISEITSSSIFPSISINAIASPPTCLRPKWKEAMLMLLFPNLLPKSPMKPGLS